MTQQIHAAMLRAMHEAAEVGIAKTATASLGGASVRYRGIEAAMNTMVGILVRNGITVTSTYSCLDISERAKAEGKATRFAVLLGTFRFSAADGSFVEAIAYGEAMDSGDKAVTKAQSVAFRIALFQTFVVPTKATAIDPEEDGDDEPADIPQAAIDAAAKGTAAYAAYWGALSNAERRALFPSHEALKAQAAAVDAKAPA